MFRHRPSAPVRSLKEEKSRHPGADVSVPGHAAEPAGFLRSWGTPYGGPATLDAFWCDPGHHLVDEGGLEEQIELADTSKELTLVARVLMR